MFHGLRNSVSRRDLAREHDFAWLDEQQHQRVVRSIAAWRARQEIAEQFDQVRPSTRRELARRIGWAVDYMLADLSREISLPELASSLRIRVMRLSRNLRRQAGTGLSASLLSALTTVERNGPMTIGTLADAEQVKPPTMTKVVASLVEQGLVTRDSDPLDGRVAWVMATPEGRSLLRRTRRRSDAYLATLLRSLDREELLVLERASRLLERLTEEAR